MGLFNTPNIDLTELVTAVQGLKLSTEIGNNDLLLAINKIQFNQPPMVSSSILDVILQSGESKQIIPASNSPRRIIIQGISGEAKLLLGTSENIINSPITINNDRLVDERWQGPIFAYSSAGAILSIAIETAGSSGSANNNNNSNNGDDMPYFANKQALIDNNANYQTGQNIILGDSASAGTNIWLYFHDVNFGTTFITDSDRLAFTYKQGVFCNLSSPAYANTLNNLKLMPDWMINFYRGREIAVYTAEVNGTVSEQIVVKQWEKFIIDAPGEKQELFPLRIALQNSTYHLQLIARTPTIYVSDAIDATLTSNLRNYIYSIVGGKIYPGEEIIFHFKNVVSGTVENPIRVKILGRELLHSYDMYEFTPFLYCYGGPDVNLDSQL